MYETNLDGDWIIWKDDEMRIHVRCATCGQELPLYSRIPDVCPKCGSVNVPPERSDQ